jgi:hypothetical protein
MCEHETGNTAHPVFKVPQILKAEKWKMPLILKSSSQGLC